jgi:hypothetical protein
VFHWFVEESLVYKSNILLKWNLLKQHYHNIRSMFWDHLILNSLYRKYVLIFVFT